MIRRDPDAGDSPPVSSPPGTDYDLRTPAAVGPPPALTADPRTDSDTEAHTSNRSVIRLASRRYVAPETTVIIPK